MIRPIQMSSSTSAISIYDAAFDAERASATTAAEVYAEGHAKAGAHKSVLDAYLEQRLIKPSAFRELGVPVVDGLRLTVFELGVIPPADLNRIEDECRAGRPDVRANELYWRCFLAALRDIGDGWGGDAEIPKVKIGGVLYVDPSWTSRMFAGRMRRVALDIGAQAWAWNQVFEVEIKN